MTNKNLHLITGFCILTTIAIVDANPLPIEEVLARNSMWRQTIPENAQYITTDALKRSNKVWVGDGFALISTSSDKEAVTINYEGGYGVIPDGQVTLNIGKDFLIPKGSDRAVSVIDHKSGKLWDFWLLDTGPQSSKRTAKRAVSTTIPSLAHSDKQKKYANKFVPAGIRAAWVWAGAGLLEAPHYSGQEITYALAASLSAAQLKSGPIGIAVAEDTDGQRIYQGTIPMGTRLAIPHYININQLGLTSTIGKNIARAAQQYGIYVVDQHGGDAALQIYSNPATVNNNLNIPLRHWWEPKNQDLVIIKNQLLIAP